MSIIALRGVTAKNRTARERRAELLPEIGVSLPVWLIRAGMAVVMLGVSLAEFGVSTLFALGVVGTIAVLVFRRAPIAWMFVLLIAASILQTTLTGPSWQLAVAIAGTHTLHEFGVMSAWLPERGRVQRSVLARLLRSWLVIQVPVQLAALALVVLITGTSIATALASPVFGVIAGLCLVGLVALVLVPILRGARPN
ncbi:MAG: hypothetical protein QOF79_1822 [Actinomycetota bacterium]|nr:hypothetical protein [Actinomycetota bacterium]